MSGRIDVHVVCVKFLEVLGCLFVLALLEIADTGIQCCQLALLIVAVLVCDSLKTDALSVVAVQRLVEIARHEISHSLGVLVRCLQSFRLDHVLVDSDDTHHYNGDAANDPTDEVCIVLNPFSGACQRLIYFF